MRLYNTFNHYFLFVFLFLFTIHCFGQDHSNELNKLIENEDEIENDFQYSSPPLSLQLSNDILSENRTEEDDQILISSKIEAKSPLLFNTVRLIENYKIVFELFFEYFRMKMKIIQ
jgi:hypothetical protein